MGEADAAIADQGGRDAVPRRWGDPAAPSGLGIVMGVGIDEAGGYDFPPRVDFFQTTREVFANRGDLAVG